MHRLGIQTGADLWQWDEMDLVRHFGKPIMDMPEASASGKLFPTESGNRSEQRLSQAPCSL